MRTIRVLAGTFLCFPCIAAIPQNASNAAQIGRHALVTRHNIVLHNIDPMGAMAVGNGEFAFNFDVTGLQSFPQ